LPQTGVADRIRFLEGDLFEPLSETDLIGRVDVIAANPPYIRSEELPALQPEVRDFEPEMALIAGPDGTEIAERILNAAPNYLRSGGSLIMEMGMGQTNALRKIIAAAGAYAEPEVLKDLAGIERVIVAVKK
jgi:release factor glutamine methyltransferase